ncbi:MAG: hypothetical protein H8E66_10475 [Planctomycetes bacterium]|nr:hypothetical protein [Planctomycetota bacterium]
MVKKPKAGARPSHTGKGAIRTGANADGNLHKRPVWKLDLFDIDGPWGRLLLDEESLWQEIFPKLQNYESMTWGQIDVDRKKNHSVSVEKCSPKAQKRLRELRLEYDQLFRFGLSGLRRLWGIRDRDVFHVLWWDPKHEVYPSTLKHT